MLPSGLVGMIETLRERIARHRPALSQSEALTRYALIDPLLRELGWDTADPDLVTPEYQVGGGRADYALLGESGKPQAFIEAKHFGESLESQRSVEQVFTYALTQQVKYAGLTDGDRWILDDVSDFSGSNRRKLDVSISKEPSYQSALKLLLLWRPNLASGEPVAAREPIVAAAGVDSGVVVPASPQTAVITPVEPPIAGSEWIQLTVVSDPTGKPAPSTIRLPGGEEKQLSAWNHVIFEVAEYLVRTGRLTAERCPIQVPSGTRYIVHSTAIHSNDRTFGVSHRLSNGLFCEGDVSGTTVLNNAKFLLQHCGVDAGTVHIKFD